MGLCGSGQVIRPLFFFKRNGNGGMYFYMINENIVPQLEETFERKEQGLFRIQVPLGVQDGTPAHRLFAVRGKNGKHVRSTDNSPQSRFGMAPAVSHLTSCDFISLGMF